MMDETFFEQLRHDAQHLEHLRTTFTVARLTARVRARLGAQPTVAHCSPDGCAPSPRRRGDRDHRALSVMTEAATTTNQRSTRSPPTTPRSPSTGWPFGAE